MKKLISLFTTLCIVFSMLGTFTVFAEETAADLEISTLAELEAFRDDVNNGNTYEGKTVKLTADIDMSSYYGKYAMSWTPIGTFAGTFDGANHAILGLYINTDEDNVALFDTVYGTVKNLNVKGSVSTTSMSGNAAGITSSNNGSIINCTFDGTVECPHYFAAGISADNGGVIENCKVSGKIIGEHNVGGISGYSGGEFINCINEAEIIGWAPVGGIASSGAGSKITNCINKGSVTGRSYVNTYTNGNGEEITKVIESFSIGGIVGETSTMDTIENCYNTGAISGNSDVGGIIGVAGGSPEEPLQVKNCYNIGNITSTMENDGEHNLGAIIGNREYEDWYTDTKIITSEAVNCYYLVGTADKGCGGNADDTATALTTEQFADKTNFANWDFDTVWEMDVTSGRPVLRSSAEDTDEVIEISTLAELEAFRDDVNSGNTYATKIVKLTADIDMSEKYGEGKESWTPIGNHDWENKKSFWGIFDGGNHTISGLYINTDKEFAALFEVVDGTIKNLNVKGYVLTTNEDGHGNSAGIAAIVYEYGAIINCSFDGISESPDYVAAGIVSDNQGLISGCKFNGQVTGIHLTAGIASRNYGTITNCINEGEITATIWGGGIMAGGSGGTVTNCVNKGTVKGVSYKVEWIDEPETSCGIGGIAGIVNNADGVIENCYNIGAVSGNSDVGGILGTVEYWGDEVVNSVTVKNCYNIGNVTSTLENNEEHYIGGVIGNVECTENKVIGGEAINCYYLTGTADKGISAVGEGGTDTTTVLTTEQFADKTNFNNWDFETVWKMDATLGRPVLLSNTETADKVIEISTLAELEAFRDDVNNGNTYEGKTVKLTADIDMSEKYGEDKESWTPIGIFAWENPKSFSGTFDGCNYTVNNLYINIPEYTGTDGYGLFGTIDGTLKNLNVNGSVNAYSNMVAGIVMSVGENGAVSNCSFDGAVKGNTFVGGIATLVQGLISDCHCSGTVDGEHMVGGIVCNVSNALDLEEKGIVENCTNESTVTAGSMAGGIVGALNIYVTVKGCVNKGEVKGVATEREDAEIIGGIAGTNENSHIENCYNTGVVSGKQKIGGITGTTFGPYSDYYTNKLAVKNCYNIGNVTATGDEPTDIVGGVVGEIGVGATNNDITNCYYLDTCISGEQTVATALTTEQFADEENFTNWDFETVWKMDATLGRPVLRSNTEDTDEVIEISTLEELEAFRDDVNNGNTYEGKTVKLTADIDMSEKYGEGKENWTMIGSWKYPFSGTFDGGNHTINGLYAHTDEENTGASFFCVVSGIIKNLNVTGTVIAEVSPYEGSAAGIVLSLDSDAQMLNCSFDGLIKNVHYMAGGLVGTNAGRISDCTFKGKVDSMHLVGGIASTGGGTIINCINEGEIIGTTPVGGIAGWGQTIKNCINKGSVTGRTYDSIESFSIGGIAGTVDNRDSVENCYNIGAVSGNSKVGGIIGDGYNGEPEATVKVKNCYNIGNITSTMENDSEHEIGSIIGSRQDRYHSEVIISEAVNCYYLVGTADKGCGGNADDTATALTTEQFADEENFTNWDFETVWKMDATLGRPVLRSGIEEPPMEHTHTLVHHAAVAATCTETGTGEYWKCEGTDACNKMFSDENGTTEITEIPTTAATGHTEVTDARIEPTCETDGKTAGSHCSVCQTVITAQTTIPKINHNWGAWSISEEPTDYVPGYAERICQNDNEHKDFAFLPVLTDKTVWTAGARVEPTETADGSQAYTSDYGSVTITIPALGHTHDWGAWSIAKEPTFTESGIAERVCKENSGHKDTFTLPILTDTTVWTEDLKIEPTETENGSVTYTSQYGNVTIIIPALNPDYDYSIKYENGKAIVTVPQDGTYTVIFAAYDNGRLLSVNAQDIQLVKGENSPISPQNFNANGKVKVMLWDSLKGMKPLCAADGN